MPNLHGLGQPGLAPASRPALLERVFATLTDTGRVALTGAEGEVIVYLNRGQVRELVAGLLLVDRAAHDRDDLGNVIRLDDRRHIGGVR